MIKSLDNKTVKELFKLNQKKYRKDSFLITDKDLIDLAYKTNHLKQLIYIDNPPFEFDNCLQVSKEVLNKICQKQNIEYLGVSKFIEENNNYQKRVLLLDQLQDPLNVGRILETCMLFNFDSIICSLNCADIYNEKCLDNCKGGIYKINIVHADLKQEINKLKDLGFKVFATGLSSQTKLLSEINTYDKMAFVLGNEGSGVSKQIMDLCDEIIKIDMRNIDSLNVAMAASIITYRFRI